ncbi:uncharacterized protein B0H18DRAFT_961039 [Fomitopsis serialis]|uniref:uncharacterized protein n=1 Tax=Fomitopsis serialis TaxID=139415 RepID=UPI0020072B22|nr:uncharacterized protein B0H18DRAFT_961039 [Neoantrodia serialis]KAH9912452.1 hypothetical protein B0H18DRAFT_961039 [Neoantrodia serialis]
MPTTVGKGIPATSSSAVDTSAPPANLPQRSASESRKRRRASADVDGENVTTGTVLRTQDVSAATSPPRQVEYVVDIGEVLGFPRLDWSPAPDDNQVDPPATTTSDLEERDFEMFDPVTGQEDRAEVPYEDREGAARTRRLSITCASPDTRWRMIPCSDTGTRSPAKAYGRATLKATPLMPTKVSATRAQTPANDIHRGPRRPRSPSLLHPYPVHYAPGPFPNFPVDLAPPAPIAQDAPAGPAGPIAPLAPAPGAPPPLTTTRAPENGWPRIQGVGFDLVYANVLASQADEWRRARDYHVYIHFPGRGAHDRAYRRCPPTSPNSNPIYYRVGNLTVGQRDRLLREGWVSSRDGTFGVVSSEPSPPTFMGTFRHPLRLGETSEEGMANAFKKGMRSEEMRQYLLTTLNSDIFAGGRWRRLTAQDAYELIISSITVKKILLRNTRDEEEEPFAFLYMESPTSDPIEWLNFRNRVRTFTFGGLLAGPPELVTRSFYCMYCHSVDHPTHACTIPSTPGWHGPSLDDVREMLAADRRAQGQDQRGGGRGGRGGRGSRGGRGRGNGRGNRGVAANEQQRTGHA